MILPYLVLLFKIIKLLMTYIFFKLKQLNLLNNIQAVQINNLVLSKVIQLIINSIYYHLLSQIMLNLYCLILKIPKPGKILKKELFQLNILTLKIDSDYSLYLQELSLNILVKKDIIQKKVFQNRLVKVKNN